jgi:hypothetical protein
MRLLKVSLATLFLALLTVTVRAQQDKASMPAKQQDAMDAAHTGILSTPSATEKATEAGRLTEAVSKGLPQTALSTAPMPRKNFIDEQIFGRMERDGIPHAPLAGDEEFVRRVYLDATGLLASPEKVREFLASKDPDKRDKLIDSLIGTDAFAENWAWTWGDLLQTRNILFTNWLQQWWKTDRPYDQVATEIISPGVMKIPGNNPTWVPIAEQLRINTRSVDTTDPGNYYTLNRLDFLDSLNVKFGQAFLGINMDCFSCHDGAGHLEPINVYLSTKTRNEFAANAAFWGKLDLVPTGITAMNTIMKETRSYNTANDAPYVTMAENRFPRDGKVHEPAFILTGEKPKPGVDPRKELARMVTGHVQFDRAAVNIVWGKLMTVGFVEPIDGFDLARLDPNNPPKKPWDIQPTNPWLLEALAKDFRANNFSMHHLIKTIMKSNAYQLSTSFPVDWKDQYAPYYARRLARVLTGPEIIDNLAQISGQPWKFRNNATRVAQLAQPLDVNPPEAANGGGNNDLGNEGTIEGNSIKALMQSFFQSTRETPGVSIGNRASAVQAMLMMTAPVINNRVSAKPNSRVATLLASKTDTEVLNELFLSTLSRLPRPEETEVGLRLFRESKDRAQNAEDIQWALLNSVEFLLNH